MPLHAGTRVGPYEIVAAIGAGGMGEVYRARDAKLGRDVALKVLPESFASDPDRLARFHREAQVLGALNHPNIAQIYGFEDSGATHALVMELVEGPTLADRLLPGRLPLDESLAIAKQIATALEAAHDQGIVHRDLKPANVKVRDDGTVKVLDFGLAKAMAPDGAGTAADTMNSPTLTRATQFGTILGTASYMAPEQAKGRTVDRRADIWAFGVVLFEMLSGERPFKGEDVSDVLAAVLRQEIDWAALPADTPARVRRVLQRCLERDVKRRLRDIGDVWIGMDDPESPSPAAVAAPQANPVSGLSRWLPWMAVFAIAAGSSGWFVYHRPTSEPGVVMRSTQTSKDLMLFVRASRDGTRLVYVNSSSVAALRSSAAGPAIPDSSAAEGIALRMLDQFEGRVVPGTQGGNFPLLSPDGLWIAYDSGGKIKKVPITGGTSSPLCDGSLVQGGAWADNNTIVFSSPKGLWRVSADGGTPEALTTVDAAKGEAGHVRPQFLPDGRLLFTVMAQGDPQFAVKDLSDPGYKIVAKGGLNGQYAASGHLTFVRGSTLFAVPFDLSRLEVTGGEVPVVENVSTNGPSGTADYSVSDAGILAYISSPEAAGTILAWADRSGVTKSLPGQSRQLWGTGRLSPDGRMVANGVTAANGVRDIWTYDVERGTQTRLSFGDQKETYDLPVWTPDNRRVYFAGNVSGKRGIYVVPVDGSSKPSLVLATDGAATPTSVTPDGKTLLYQQVGPDQRFQLFVLPLTPDGQPTQPHPLHDAVSTEKDAVVSPDGHWVAYTSAETNTVEVYVLPFPGPGPKIHVSLDGGTKPRWSKDGRELFYWANIPTSTLMSVDVSTSPAFHAGAPRELFRQMSTTTWDVTPDKNRFLVEISSHAGGSTLAVVTNWFDELRRRVPARK